MVTAILNNPGAVAGQEVYQGSGAVFFRGNKATGFAVAKGDILVKDTGTAPDSYKLATGAAVSADTKISLAKGGLWYVTGGDTIEPGDVVMLSTTVAGQTVKSTAVTTVAIQQAVVGTSYGFADSFGTGLPVASVVGDLYVLELGHQTAG